MIEAIVNFFMSPERGIMGVIIVALGAVVVYLYISGKKDSKESSKQIQDLNNKLLEKAEAYADSKTALAEKVTDTIGTLNAVFKNRSGDI